MISNLLHAELVWMPSVCYIPNKFTSKIVSISL